ncbi:DNA polymerase [Bacillus sp. FSL R7-0642]|uniref:DNA polymerase n=1 Tax=Bacillus sp. FSL R7-0642 TaxID=2921585 RepID=UPI0030F579EF
MLNLNGLPFDYAEWKQILSEMEVELGALENEIQAFLNQAELNLASPQQVLQSFASKGIQVPSTKEEDLAKYEMEYPIIQKLCKYKKIKKRLTTYGETLQRRIGCDDKIRGEWRLIGTGTSRMSCKSPNLQGLPTQAKPYVKAPSGECFVIADYSTIELRILAEITHDQELITAFQKKQDLHEKTARAIFDKSEDAEITADERKIGKVVNFGLIYGMTAYGLQKKITFATGKEISYQQAQVFRNRYFGLYPGVLRYQDQMLKAERIFTLGGRYWSSETTALKSVAISRFNYPIQGTGAEGLKESLAILMQHLPPNWKLVAVVHDEIVLQVPENESTNAKQCLRIAMQKGMQQLIHTIPIEIDVKISTHWAK